MTTLGQAFRHYGKDLPPLFGAILIGVINNICVMIAPLATQLLIDRVITPALGGDVSLANNLLNRFIDGFAFDDYWGMFWVLASIYIILTVVKLSCYYIRWNIAHILGTRVDRRLRTKVFKHMMNQNSIVLSKYTSGELLNLCGGDIITIREFFAMHIMYFFGMLTLWLISSYMLFIMHPLLLIVPAIGGVMTLISTRFMARITRRRFEAIRAATVHINTTVQENIQGVRVIRSYAAENIEQTKFDTANDILRDKYIAQLSTQAKASAFFALISQCIFFGSMFVGVFLAVDGQLTAGQFATIFVYVVFMSDQFNTLSNLIGQIQNTKIAGKRVFGFLNTPITILDGANPPDISHITKPNIKVSNISVVADDKTLIKDISVDIPYGKKLGIMGKTGSGKTALIKSLMRFFDCSSGGVTIDGIDIRDCKVDDIRRIYSYTMQDVFLFSDTVKNNIAFYDPETTLEEVQRYARLAIAHDFILELSDGYETIVGEHGVGLSGGQKQRVSMARAFFKNAPILLFDDCTSALDMDTERQVMHNIAENFAGRTIVIATHRASSVRDCDEILYLDDGIIIERGTHAQLMQLQGKYFEVYTAQLAMKEDMAK